MELDSFGLRQREKEMIKERRKTARGEAGMRGREERASVRTPCVKRADGNRG